MEMPAGLKNEIERRAAQVGVKALSAAAEAMSQAYRAEHGTGKRLVQGETAVLAYGAVRMPATYGAVYKALRLSMACYDGEVRSVLDVGAGTGAACWAAQALLPTYAAYTCIEREPAMLALGKGLMAEQEELCDAEWILADMTAGLRGQKADLVMASYTLNELTEQARTDMVSKLWEGTEGMLLIIEPGTPVGFAQLRKAREMLIALGGNADDQMDLLTLPVDAPRIGQHRQAGLDDVLLILLLAVGDGDAVSDRGGKTTVAGDHTLDVPGIHVAAVHQDLAAAPNGILMGFAFHVQDNVFQLNDLFHVVRAQWRLPSLY